LARGTGIGIGIDPSAIYAFEHGRRDPRLSTVQPLARGLRARVLVVSTQGRARTAETLALIRGALAESEFGSAMQVFLQFVITLAASDTLAFAALTTDQHDDHADGRSLAIAGVEIDPEARGIRTPQWAIDTSGEPTYGGAHGHQNSLTSQTVTRCRSRCAAVGPSSKLAS
jgi:hypothetical protein